MSGLVSIVIPCYNAGKYVAEAIQSALDQSYSNCEVIVIDDGSSDDSLEAIKRFGDRIRWSSEPNRGGCAARNAGIKIARGEWLQFLDADDILTKDSVAEKMAHSGREDIVAVTRAAILPGYPAEMITDFWTADSYPLEYMLHAGTPQTSQPLHRTASIHEIGGFNEDLPCANEYDLHLRLSITLGLEFKVINTVGVYIRPLAESLSRKPGRRMALSVAKARLNAFRLISDGSATISSLKSYEDLLIPTARLIWQAGMREDALWLHEIAAKLSNRWWKSGYGRGSLKPALASVIGFKSYERLISLLQQNF